MSPDQASKVVLDAAFKVHSALGPGLLEETYKVCLAHKLASQRVKVLTEVGLPVCFEGIALDVGYRIDLLVEDVLIVELKSVKQLAPIHTAQILTYLKLSKISLGLLLNFNTVHLKHGIQRVINT